VRRRHERGADGIFGVTRDDGVDLDECRIVDPPAEHVLDAIELRST
jgi:hypothetical protein